MAKRLGRLTVREAVDEVEEASAAATGLTLSTVLHC